MLNSLLHTLMLLIAGYSCVCRDIVDGYEFIVPQRRRCAQSSR